MIKDMTGQRFGKLTVIELAEKDKRGECKWLCKCDCGNTKIVYGYHLRKGHTVSCGCVMRTQHITHHESKTRLYRIWQKVRNRCDNPRCDKYEYYGGRGITYCSEWNNYEVFRKWALENGYKDNLTIERIDVNRNYEPSNCTWIPQTEQLKNTRRTIRLTWNGETHTIREWSQILGKSYKSCLYQYHKGVNIFE